MNDDVRQGDLYWIAATEAGGVPAAFAHPHVVVQDDLFNRSRVATVVVCALTTNLKMASEPGNVLLDPGEGNLPKRSVVVVSQIASVDRAALGPRIGRLSAARVDAILAGLRFQQAAYFRTQGEPMLIRDEQSGDVEAIRQVVREAFATAAHASGTEPDIVEALRAAGALSVSLVAEVDGEVVGHVAVSPVAIEDGAQGWYGLGPLAVAPAHQRRGIGARLMEAAIARLRERGAAGCVLLGDPAYYGRFGFEPAAPLVLPGVSAEYFQALELNGSRPRGAVRYHEAFGV